MRTQTAWLVVSWILWPLSRSPPWLPLASEVLIPPHRLVDWERVSGTRCASGSRTSDDRRVAARRADGSALAPPGPEHHGGGQPRGARRRAVQADPTLGCGAPDRRYAKGGAGRRAGCRRGPRTAKRGRPSGLAAAWGRRDAACCRVLPRSQRRIRRHTSRNGSESRRNRPTGSVCRPGASTWSQRRPWTTFAGSNESSPRSPGE
jgi:hypothetical protein